MTDDTTDYESPTDDNTDYDTMTHDDTNPNGTDSTREKMKEMDHTPPVEGPNRTFERNQEGKPPAPDGGRPGSLTAEPEQSTPAGTGNGFSQKMKEMDHTPPVEGPNRTFERGTENRDDVAK